MPESRDPGSPMHSECADASGPGRDGLADPLFGLYSRGDAHWPSPDPARHSIAEVL